MTTSSSSPSGSPRAAIWRRLTEPAVSIQQPAQRRRARLLASLLLVLVPLGLVVLVVAAWRIGPLAGQSYPPVFFALVLTSIALLAGAYALCHAGHYTLAAALTVGVTSAATFVVVLILPSVPLTVAFMSLGMLTSSLFLSRRVTVLVFAATFAATALLPLLDPHIPPRTVVGALSFVVIMGALIWVTLAVQQEDLQRIEQQAHALAESEQAQSVLNALLRLSMENIPLIEQLERALDVILLAPFIPLKPRGGIFLAESDPEVLVLKIHRNLPPGLQTMCARVPFGRCLCGRAAARRQIEFAEGVDERHENVYAEIEPHGHYNVPILSDERVLGVLVLYLQAGHHREEREVEFLQVAANTLAGIIERKQAEEALRENEEKFQSITALAKDAIILLDNEGNIGYWNKAAEGIFGYSAQEALGKPLRILMPEQYHEAQRKGCLKFKETGEGPIIGKTLEVQAVRKDGTEFPIELSVSAVRLKGRWNAIGVLRDITERKRIDEEIRQLSHQNELILGALGEGVYGIDLEGKATFLNPAAAEMLGYRPEELIGQSMHEAVHHSKPDGTRLLREECLIYGASRNGTVNRADDEAFWRKDGTSLPVEYVSTPIREGEALAGAVVVFKDISERRRAEEALRESEKRFRSLFEDSPISLWEEDFSLVAAYLDELRHSGVTDFRVYFENHPEAVAHCATMVNVVDVNRGTLRLYQAKSKEDFLAGLNVVLSEEAIPTFREELIALAEGKTRFEGEAINQTLAGDKIHVALSWSVAPDGDKGARRLFVSINDITARRRAEEKLAAKVIELERRSREIKLLNEMGDLLQTCQTIEEAGTVVTQFAQRLFPNQAGSLCLIAASRNLVDAIAAWGEFPPQDRIFTPDDCWALRRGQVHSVTDPDSRLLCRHVSQPFGTERQPEGGYLCAPMIAQGETLGILHLRSGQPAPSQTREEQAAVMASQQLLVVAMAEQIALSLANLKIQESLRRQAIRDPLTGLFNRRYMEETLERELRRAERRRTPLGIIMFDLDHFKKFNDTFGHAAGDIVLREIGAFLQASVRAEDIACRYGGEEFLVILPEASFKDTLKRAEQLRKGIKQLHVRYHDQALGAVTVSLGVAVFPDHGSTTEAIMRGADDALYHAKQEGRDRVVSAPGMNA
ncbi:MAG: diguanylate cyclase [Chloroflexi bacterium]|nr:diguanylate cyclase [Chloroflexota bacterium]